MAGEGVQMEEMSMTATETARLIDWLMANGHNIKEINLGQHMCSMMFIR